MVGGFNHNFCYKEQTFHVQTEDSGIKKAAITTLLYRGGTILARNTTSYADILDHADLTVEIETRMKEQHKQMMRDLKSGHYDEQIVASTQKQPEKQPVVVPKLDLDRFVAIYLSAGR